MNIGETIFRSFILLSSFPTSVSSFPPVLKSPKSSSSSKVVSESIISSISASVTKSSSDESSSSSPFFLLGFSFSIPKIENECSSYHSCLSTGLASSVPISRTLMALSIQSSFISVENIILGVASYVQMFIPFTALFAFELNNSPEPL